MLSRKKAFKEVTRGKLGVPGLIWAQALKLELGLAQKNQDSIQHL